MILSDSEIRALAEQGMITPFDPALVNPASLDVRLGPNILIEVPESPSLRRFSIASYTQEAPYLVQPGEFFLGETVEVFDLPRSIAAHFVLKSSRAREGINHLLAGFADPKFHDSVLTLEIVNVKRFHPVAVWPGMLIGQMVFHRLTSEPDRDYSETGRYNGCRVVTPSKGAA